MSRRRSPEQTRLTGFAAACGRPAQTDLFGTETDPAELPSFRDPRNPDRSLSEFNTQETNQ